MAACNNKTIMLCPWCYNVKTQTGFVDDNAHFQQCTHRSARAAPDDGPERHNDASEQRGRERL
jgi:uncharacterized protein (DUF983 family)